MDRILGKAGFPGMVQSGAPGRAAGGAGRRVVRGMALACARAAQDGTADNATAVLPLRGTVRPVGGFWLVPQGQEGRRRHDPVLGGAPVCLLDSPRSAATVFTKPPTP